MLGHRNDDIITHYSAPELKELLDAANSGEYITYQRDCTAALAIYDPPDDSLEHFDSNLLRH